MVDAFYRMSWTCAGCGTVYYGTKKGNAWKEANKCCSGIAARIK